MLNHIPIVLLPTEFLAFLDKKYFTDQFSDWAKIIYLFRLNLEYYLGDKISIPLNGKSQYLSFYLSRISCSKTRIGVEIACISLVVSATPITTVYFVDSKLKNL